MVPEVSKMKKLLISWITKKNRVSHLKQEIQKSEAKIFKVLNLRLCKPQI
jgi:hypothetical protein